MANRYATPTNSYEKLGNELIQLLNMPYSSADAIITAATQMLNIEAVVPPVTDEEHKAARKLYRACLTANGVVDTALRSSYNLPLVTPEGIDDPDNPAFFPDVVGAAISIAKWEILGSRSDTKNEDDRNDYSQALRYLGIATGENGSRGQSGASLIATLDVTQGDVISPRGVKVVQMGKPERTREKRASMANAPWMDEI